MQELKRYLHDQSLSGQEVAVVLPTNRNIRVLARMQPGECDLYSASEFLRLAVTQTGVPLPKELAPFFLKRAVQKLSGEERKLLFGESDTRLAESFLSFVEASGAIFSFWRELASEMIPPARLAKEGLYTDYQTQLGVLTALSGIYRTLLAEAGFTDSADRGTPVPSALFTMRYRTVVILVSGFLTRYEQELIRSLQETHSVHLLFHFSGEHHEPHRMLEKNLGITIPRQDATLCSSLSVLECAGLAGQFDAITYAIGRLAMKGKPLTRIAVILPDESFSPWFIHADRLHLFSVSAGLGLSSCDFWQTLKLIETVQGEYLHTGHVSIDTTLTLLAQPSVMLLPDAVSLRTRLRDALKQGKLVMGTGDIGKSPLDGLLSPFLSSQPVTPTEMTRTIAQALAVLTPLVAEQEQKTAQEMQSELERLGNLFSVITDTLSPADAMHTVLSHAAHLHVPHTGGGPVTVMGILESRNMQFDTVIVPMLNDDIFPPANSKDLFLNSELRERLELPTFLDRDRLAKNYLYQIINRAETAILLFDSSPGAAPKSPFMEEITSRNTVPVIPVSTPYPAPAPAESVHSLHGALDSIPKSGAVLEMILQKGLSVTDVSTLMTCELKYLLQAVHKLRNEEPEQVLSIPPVELGKILHLALENLYRAKVYADNPEFMPMLRNEIQQAASRFDAYILNPGATFAVDQFIKNLEQFRLSELDLLKEGYLPYRMESKVTGTVAGIAVRGRIDRIDKKADGTLHVIDYKYKTVKSPKEGTVDNPDSAQLGMYALLMRQNGETLPSRLSFYDMKDAFRPVHGFDISLLDDFEAHITALFARLLSREVPFARTESVENCKYCPWKVPCGRAAGGAQ